MNSRIAFVDYDGVVNTPMWNAQGTCCSYGFPKQGKVNNFQAVQWLSEACQKFGYDIVVTSTWRLHDNYKECLINGGLRSGIEILGRTEHFSGLPRGAEIDAYIINHPEILYYIIIDDEADILEHQRDHFIQTNDSFGFGLDDFKKFENIFLQDSEQGGSIPNRKQKDYRKVVS